MNVAIGVVCGGGRRFVYTASALQGKAFIPDSFSGSRSYVFHEILMISSRYSSCTWMVVIDYPWRFSCFRPQSVYLTARMSLYCDTVRSGATSAELPVEQSWINISVRANLGEHNCSIFPGKSSVKVQITIQLLQ